MLNSFFSYKYGFPSFLFTTIMPIHISSEEEDSQCSEAPPLKKHKASTAVAAVSEVRTPRKQIATDKQSALVKFPSHSFAVLFFPSILNFSDQNTANANEKKVQDFVKKLAKAKQNTKKAQQLGMPILFHLLLKQFSIMPFLSSFAA